MPRKELEVHGRNRLPLGSRSGGCRWGKEGSGLDISPYILYYLNFYHKCVLAFVIVPNCFIAVVVVVLRSLRLPWSELTKVTSHGLWRDIWPSRYDMMVAGMAAVQLKRNKWIPDLLKRQCRPEGRWEMNPFALPQQLSCLTFLPYSH